MVDLPTNAGAASTEDSSAHLSCDVVAAGFAASASAAAPATCGAAIDVPLSDP